MGARRLAQQGFASPSHRPGYIYHIVPTDKSLAVLTSSDEILLVDRQTLQTQATLTAVPKDVTCLVPADQDGRSVACSGRDGSIVFLDIRTQKPIRQINIEGARAITTLVCDTKTSRTAAGTELYQSQALIHLWDHRSNALLWQSQESHNDDLTQLEFHPSLSNRLLSGATDGLVNIFDISMSDEDEALMQVVNHSSIHKAGFLSESAIFALSHDEKLSIHPITNEAEEYADPMPVHFDDVRPRLVCDYAIDILRLSQGTFLATGKHSSDPGVNLTPLVLDPTWSLVPSTGLEMQGAHGEEIVRTVYVDEEAGRVFTGGEDGVVKVWSATDDQNQSNRPSPEAATKKAPHHRYSPY